jgi:hypothetical protein
MELELFNEICEGNIERLKKISKIEITEDLSNKLINNMEEKILNIVNQMNNCGDELKYLASFYLVKKKNIENCIIYLKKIK